MKKTTLILTTMIASMMLAGCGNETLPEVIQSEPVGQETEKINPEDMGVKTGSSEQKEEKEEKEETTEVRENTEEKPAAQSDLMDAFLAGQASASVKDSYLTTLGYCEGELEAGAFYTLEQLQDDMRNFQFLEETVDCTFTNVEYWGLDLAHAPGQWYCISMEMLEGGSYDVGAEYFLVQELDGELKLAMSTESYYRSYTSVSDTGVVFYGGSNGAGDHVMDCYVIDANGDAKKLYSNETVYYGWTLYEGFDEVPAITNGFELAAEALTAAGLATDTLTVCQIRIGDTYHYNLDAEDQQVLEIAKPKFEEAGATLEEWDDIYALILQAAADAGMSQEAFERD